MFVHLGVAVPFRPSAPRFCRLAPYCFQLRGTSPLQHPLGPCPLLIASLGRLLWLRAQWLTLWWCRRLMPAASAPSGVCNPPRRVPVGLGSTSAMPHTLASVGSVSDLPLRRAYAPSDGLHAPDTTSLMCPLGPMSLSCWLLSPSPSEEEWGSSLGCEWVDYRFDRAFLSRWA